jgi:uncharacterized protein YcbK (DUF882 family)
MRRLALSLALALAAGLAAPLARADLQHTVSKGHTLHAIANRYHVSVKAIMEANHLKDGNHLKPGDVLVIPKAEAPKDKDGKAKDPKAKAGKDGKEPSKAGPKSGKADAKATTYAAKAKTPGVIHVRRLATTEEADLRVTDKSGKIPQATLKAMEKMLRFPTGQTHPVEARLVSLLGIVSNHFGSRKIEVVSGFRPYTPTQYTPHSNHNHGKAVDFHVIGVPNEAVRDFCRTLRNTGCGYYPNSTFVHMDVRESSAFWIDYSKPGEPPRYNAANVDADEGTSDVHTGPSVNGPPPESEPATPPGTTNASSAAPTTTAAPAPSATESDPPPATKPDGE